MRNLYCMCAVFAAVTFVCFNTKAQDSPAWTRDIIVQPDLTKINPVRVLHDANSNVYVLGIYFKNEADSKVYLKKYNSSGGEEWGLLYESKLFADFDMATDESGNCFIAGGEIRQNMVFPMLVKVSSDGDIVWRRDSTTTYTEGYFQQVILKNNRLYLSATPGLAVFDLNGNEKWSNIFGTWPGQMDADNKGQLIVSVPDVNTNIFRFDSLGKINHSDFGIFANRLVSDKDDSFYLFTLSPKYELVKYDSSGNFVWSRDSFPPIPNVEELYREMLLDYDDNVILLGLRDTMYKYSPAGELIWKKSMEGLDNFPFSARVTKDNKLVVAGSTVNGGDQRLKIVAYDEEGSEIWSGSYNANTGLEEYVADLAVDHTGYYVIENNNGNTVLIKFLGSTAIGQVTEEKIKIYPNPCIGNFLVEFPEAKGNEIFKLFDVYGRTVVDQKITSSCVSVSVETISGGIFIYQIKNTAGILTTGKLIIQH